MNSHNQPAEIENVSCEICLREVPHSESQNAEVDDYVVNFCGLECYEKWQEQKAEEK
ncbi:MAG: DUF3330 domain-containing protein [Gammaproteobacteria bacterium]|nr:DUF3330 domain-containing protein [Gammaproteobacteria bacterium]